MKLINFFKQPTIPKRPIRFDTSGPAKIKAGVQDTSGRLLSTGNNIKKHQKVTHSALKNSGGRFFSDVHR
jgi:hypothetical protein